MKKTLKQKLVLASAILFLLVLILAVLLIPHSKDYFRDGGTVIYKSALYTKVEWCRMVDNGFYENTSVFWFPNNSADYDELWDMEMARLPYTKYK